MVCNWVYGCALIRTHTHIYIYVMYILYMGSVSRHQPIGFRSQLMWQTAPWNPIIFYGLSQASKGQQSLSLSAYIYTHTNLCKYNRYIRMYIHTIYLYMYDYTYLHAHTHTRSQTHTHHTHTHTHTHIYIYIYIHIHMHTHAYMRVDGWIWSWHLDFVPAAPPLTVELEVPNGCEAQPW